MSAPDDAELARLQAEAEAAEAEAEAAGAEEAEAVEAAEDAVWVLAEQADSAATSSTAASRSAVNFFMGKPSC